MMLVSIRLISVLAAATLVGSARGATFNLVAGFPIVVREFGVQPRVQEPVTFAVPLGKTDAVTDPSTLVVIGPNGTPVPAQFRATLRWNAAPTNATKPVKWLLVDLQVDVDQGQQVTYTLRKKTGSDAAPVAPELAVSQDAETGSIEVDTGIAQFGLDGTLMNGLDVVRVDFDGDGEFEAGETVLDGPAGAGFELTDRFKALYSSTKAPVVYTVEEAGPLRVVVRADGVHAPVSAKKGIARDFFRYRTRYTFFAGKPYVRIQHTLRNAYLEEALGDIGFEGYVFKTKLDKSFAPKKWKAAYGIHDEDVQGIHAVQVKGKSRLYQDSDGGPKWNAASNTSFPGFRIYKGKKKSTVGARAAGFMHVGNGKVGVTVVMKHFLENYPKGFAFDGKQGIEFHLFPAETKSFFWLDDGQQKTTDFLFAAHGAATQWYEPIVGWFQEPIHPYAEPDWVRQTKAWGDQGNLDKPAATPAQLRAYDDGQLSLLYQQAYDRSSFAFGWSDFGEQIWAKSTHTTGSPRNKLTYLDKFAMSGSDSAFRIVEFFALHSRDIRPYHIEGFTKEKRPNATLWEALPVWPYSADKLGRDQLDPSLDPHREGIPDKGHGWNAFDMEHMVADDVFDQYVMTGDWVTLDSIREMGEVLRTWPIYNPAKAPGSTRGVGWTMRALVKIYQATGDPRFLATADTLVNTVAATMGKDPSPVTGLVYHYVTRYIPHNNHIKDDEYDLPWQLATVIHGMLLHYRETGNATSRQIALDVADYLVDYAWNGIAMNEALACDDHTYANVKYENTGVNLWIPSALILAYRENPRPVFPVIAQTMYDSLGALTNPLTYNGYTIHSWWHDYRAWVLGY